MPRLPPRLGEYLSFADSLGYCLTLCCAQRPVESDLRFRPPLRRHREDRREYARRPFLEDPSCGGGCPRIVKTSQRVDQQNIQNIARASGRMRRRAAEPAMSLAIQLHEALHLWSNKVDVPGLAWAEIQFNRLPGASSITQRDVGADGVDLFHISRLCFHAECKFIKADFQRSPQQIEPRRSRAFQSQVEILGCSSARGGNAVSSATPPFRTVRTENPLTHRSFENATQRQERNPAPQPLLIESLFASDTGQPLFKALPDFGRGVTMRAIC